MVETAQERPTSRPAGYAALIERYNLDTIPNWHQSKVTTSGIHRVNAREDVIEEIYPLKYWPGETLGNHLEFALKYDGTNLAILASLFQNIEADEFLEYVRSKPTGKYARRLWFLYEFLTGKTLPLDDLTRGNYVDLLEPDAYYTVAPARPIRRQRINDNLLGDRRFCPTIRRTAILRDLETADLPARCQRIVSRYDPALLKRALGYLYTKETKSSFAIEQINPTSTRTEHFVALLQLAEQEDFCRKAQLVEVQNRIVDAHNILARRGFTPKGVMFPISAAMLGNSADYDASLEAFSRKLMPLIEHTLDANGRLIVHNDIAVWYRYIDMTPQAEALFRFIEQTIDTELAAELAFLANYDETKKAIQEIVDMPDRQIDLFIRFCLQNKGRLSARKRATHFDYLSAEEIASMEQALQSEFGGEIVPSGD